MPLFSWTQAGARQADGGLKSSSDVSGYHADIVFYTGHEKGMKQYGAWLLRL
jgi:hypothetical protein